MSSQPLLTLPSCTLTQASTAWCDLDMWEQSDVVLTFAAKAATAACTAPLQQYRSSTSTGMPDAAAAAATSGRCQGGAGGVLSASKAEQLCALLFDVHVARYLTTVKLNQQVGGLLTVTSICLIGQGMCAGQGIQGNSLAAQYSHALNGRHTGLAQVNAAAVSQRKYTPEGQVGIFHALLQ